MPGGAYALTEDDDAALTMIATGSEVALALAARDALAGVGTKARVVSMPSWELFEEQDNAYGEEVLPRGLKNLAIEAGITQGWHKYVGDNGGVISVDGFGLSAPGSQALAHAGFTVENIVAQARALIG